MCHDAEVSTSAVQKLIAAGSGPLVEGSAALPRAVPTEIAELLTACDGFYAFESALHVFPSVSVVPEVGLTAWNANELWRHLYPDLDDGVWFFAADIFGCQFALVRDAVSVFDPETGGFEPMAADVEGWAQAILDDLALYTGFPIAHEWQLANGALLPGRRLIPKIPFVLGGAFDALNLYDVDAVQGMRYRAELAEQMQDLPDGATVRLRVVE